MSDSRRTYYDGILLERDAIILRSEALRMLKNNNLKEYQHAPAHLAELLGFKDYYELANAMPHDARLTEKIRLLGGPNGYTIYKMLVAQRNI